MQETIFEGSVLRTELVNTNSVNKLAKFKQLTENAFKEYQSSLFWSDAINFIYDKWTKLTGEEINTNDNQLKLF